MYASRKNFYLLIEKNTVSTITQCDGKSIPPGIASLKTCLSLGEKPTVWMVNFALETLDHLVAIPRPRKIIFLGNLGSQNRQIIKL